MSDQRPVDVPPVSRAMSTLHQDAHWSQHPVDAVISQVKKQVSKTAQEFLSQENLQYYREELAGQKNEGHSVSLVDMFGLFIERLIFGKVSGCTR